MNYSFNLNYPIESSKVGIKTKKVKAFLKKPLLSLFVFTIRNNYPLYSSETVNLALPFARRAANTRRPLAVCILERNPCLFFLFLLDGWNVLFIFLYLIIILFHILIRAAKIASFFYQTKFFGLLDSIRRLFRKIFLFSLQYRASEYSSFVKVIKIRMLSFHQFSLISLRIQFYRLLQIFKSTGFVSF